MFHERQVPTSIKQTTCCCWLVTVFVIVLLDLLSSGQLKRPNSVTGKQTKVILNSKALLKNTQEDTSFSILNSSSSWAPNLNSKLSTMSPTSNPTRPTSNPTPNPTNPTLNPTHPTSNPTPNPTNTTLNPTLNPSSNPTLSPTSTPTSTPTTPSLNPTLSPSLSPTLSPTSNPTLHPTAPTLNPTLSPASETLKRLIENLLTLDIYDILKSNISESLWEEWKQGISDANSTIDKVLLFQISHTQLIALRRIFMLIFHSKFQNDPYFIVFLRNIHKVSQLLLENLNPMLLMHVSRSGGTTFCNIVRDGFKLRTPKDVNLNCNLPQCCTYMFDPHRSFWARDSSFGCYWMRSHTFENNYDFIAKENSILNNAICDEFENIIVIREPIERSLSFLGVISNPFWSVLIRGIRSKNKTEIYNSVRISLNQSTNMHSSIYGLKLKPVSGVIEYLNANRTERMELSPPQAQDTLIGFDTVWHTMKKIDTPFVHGLVTALYEIKDTIWKPHRVQLKNPNGKTIWVETLPFQNGKFAITIPNRGSTWGFDMIRGFLSNSNIRYLGLGNSNFKYSYETHTLPPRNPH